MTAASSRPGLTPEQRARGGRNRAAKLSPERRSEIARAAGHANFAKQPPERREKIVEHRLQQLLDCAPDLSASQRERLRKAVAANGNVTAPASQEEAAAG